MGLTTSTIGLRTGWFSGTSVAGRQYIGPGGYFSTEGFPAEAYDIAASWEVAPEVAVAEIVIAESVLGALPVDGAYPVTAPPLSKMMGAMAIASLLPEERAPYIPSFQTGIVGAAYMPPAFAGGGAIIGVGAAILPWILRMMGLAASAGFGLDILGMFRFGRIFLYFDGKAIGSLEPEQAWVWFSNLSGNQQRKTRMRMEGADKGGKYQRAPGYTGGSGDTQGSLPGESFWEKANPFSPGSIWDRIIPWI